MLDTVMDSSRIHKEHKSTRGNDKHQPAATKFRVAVTGDQQGIKWNFSFTCNLLLILKLGGGYKDIYYISP